MALVKCLNNVCYFFFNFQPSAIIVKSEKLEGNNIPLKGILKKTQKPEEEFAVEKIMDKAFGTGGKVKYLIKWKGRCQNPKFEN